MRNLMQGIICLLLIFSCIRSAAQKTLVREPNNKRPSLFLRMPQSMNCRINELESVLNYPVGSAVNIKISDSLQFQGMISSAAAKYDNRIQSVVIRSSNLQGAALTISKITNEDGSIRFTGRIISFGHADAYEIIYEKGQYSFVKKGFYDMVND